MKMMFKRFAAMFFCAFCIIKPAVAQSDFSINLYGGSQNFWSSNIVALPTNIINNIIASIINEDSGEDVVVSRLHYQYEFLKVKNGGEKVDMYNGKYFGFKGKDLFSNIHYGLKFGWQPELSPFGIYVSCAYQFRRFELKMDEKSGVWDKYKIHCVKPGIGIRVTPFVNMLKYDDVSPIVEIGTSYNYVIGCKAPYDNSKEQFNNVLSSSFAIGARFLDCGVLSNCSLTAGVEIDHNSLFNTDFTPDDGITYPYKDVKTSRVTVFVTMAHDF